MRTRRTTVLLAAAVLLGAVSACGQGEPGTRPSEEKQPRSAEQPAPVVDGSAMEQTVAGMRWLAGTFGDAAAVDGQNTVYSPASLAYAFAMLRAGADGETASQLDKVFGFPGDKVHAVMRALRQDVVTTGDAPPRGSGDEARKPGEPPADPIVAIANGLFVQQDAQLGADFVKTLSRDYGAAAEQVDFASDQAKDTIDDWVREQTADRIDKLFDELDPDTVAVLANAVYLKAEWQFPFEEFRTKDDAFRLSSGRSVAVPLMSMETTELKYVDGDGWQAVELPYAGGELAMWVLVPDDAKAPPPPLTADTLAKLDGGTKTMVDITMPRWDFATDVQLLPALEKLGLTNLAQLPGVAPAFRVTDAIHRANITVDEAGTEAAAVTGIAGTTSLGPQAQVTVRADHPFSFAITRAATRAPLFVGSVADPSQS